MSLKGILNRRFCTFNNKFYITTPIYYVNASPHIGHLYSSLIADCYQRFRKLIDGSATVTFATGTDEHGGKIQKASEVAGKSPAVYCDEISLKYKELAQHYNIDYTYFIRTTDVRHKETVTHFWNTIYEKGYIYKTKYNGWYSISDETFLTDSQLKEVKRDDKTFLVSQESGHPVEWTEEENFMFKLSEYKGDLKHWLLNNEKCVQPGKFHKIVMDYLSCDLRDISVSRPASRINWAIPVPNDHTQTIYVWLDALINYLTVVGYPESENHWPADVHVIGKDILKFHAIYWPAFLMSAGLEPPRTILCHSHWTVDAEKMSKSKGNVVCPIQRSGMFSSDGFRYFLLREGVNHSDGNYSESKALNILNSELADTLGNLLSRCTGAALNPRQMFTQLHESSYQRLQTIAVTRQLVESVERLPEVCYAHYMDFNFYKCVDAVMQTLRIGNLFFETLQPWVLKKDPSKHDDLESVLHLVQETLRVVGIIMQPVIPTLSAQLLNKLNIPTSHRNWKCLNKLSWHKHSSKEWQLSSNEAVLFRRIVLEDGNMTAKKSRKKDGKVSKC